MDFEEVELWGDALLLKIHAITGWVLPEKTILTVFQDQFRKKLAESYSHCNPDEIEYAFRNEGTAIKDWGKQMNLSLIDEVMIPYLSRRFELSRLEEHKSKPIAQIENKEDMSTEAMSLWFDDISEKVRTGNIIVEFIPISIYDWMDANGNIPLTKEQKWDYIKRARNYRIGKIREALDKEDSAENRFLLSEFNRMDANKRFEGSEASTIKMLSKQMIVFELILAKQHC